MPWITTTLQAVPGVRTLCYRFFHIDKPVCDPLGLGQSLQVACSASKLAGAQATVCAACRYTALEPHGGDCQSHDHPRTAQALMNLCCPAGCARAPGMGLPEAFSTTLLALKHSRVLPFRKCQSLKVASPEH